MDKEWRCEIWLYIYALTNFNDGLAPVVTKSTSSWWRHQIKTFPALLAFCEREIHWSPGDSPHKGQWLEALMFCLFCDWTNGWTNNRDDGDLRRHHAHCDVTVMMTTTVFQHYHHGLTTTIRIKHFVHTIWFCWGEITASFTHLLRNYLWLPQCHLKNIC